MHTQPGGSQQGELGEPGGPGWLVLTSPAEDHGLFIFLGQIFQQDFAESCRKLRCFLTVTLG